jgi:integrase/recombinase XerD
MPINDLRHLMPFRAPDSANSFSQESYLFTLATAFLLDRKAQNLTENTIDFYRSNLQMFLNWCDMQAVKTIDQITPEVIRLYMLYLDESGHNAGGICAKYRSIRAFLRWYQAEFEPTAWRDPLAKVKPPRVDIEPLEPVTIEHVRMLIDTCRRGKFTDVRDHALFHFLLDTGVRAGELLALDRQDVDLLTGDVLIRKSKSRKSRTVFLGRQARRSLRSYLKVRDDNMHPLFISEDCERLTMSGLRQIILRRAKYAGIPAPSLHSFRRAFTLAMLRAGVDLITLQRILGHADLSQLCRYLAQSADDLRNAHERGSPADNLL